MEANDCDPGGIPSERTTTRYTSFADGNWGVVFVEAASVTPSPLARIHGMIITDKTADGVKRLIEAFRKANDKSLLLFQLTHSGRKSGDFSVKTTVIPDNDPQYTYLDTEDLKRLVDTFVHASSIVERSGADGIDMKLCHGFLGGEMTRPANTRSDEYGGSFENRTRFFREVIEGIKSTMITKDFILGSRFSFYEGTRGGFGTASPDEIIEDTAEPLALVDLMDRLGLHYVNVSAGMGGETPEMMRPTPTAKALALHQLRYTKLVKDHLIKNNSAMKVMGTSYTIFGKQAAGLAEENIGRGYTDFAGFGRMTFSDPQYPQKLESGEPIDFCKTCNGCSKLIADQKASGCIVYNPAYKKR